MLAALRTMLILAVMVSIVLSGCASTIGNLQRAAANGDAESVAQLLEAGADPSFALDNAAGAGHAEIVQILLAAGANPSGGLAAAAESGQVHIVEILLAAGADPSRGIATAAESGQTHIVEILLAAGADPTSALDNAAGAGHAEIVQFLLAAGADPSEGLAAAANSGQTHIVKILLAAGADPSEGLAAAILAEDIELFQNLLAAGADPTFGLPTAVARGHTDIVKILLAAGADPSEGLASAVRWENTKILAILLESGGDPNDADWIHRSHLSLTPLHWAAWKGHLEITERLIEAGADIEARAHHRAAELGDIIAISLLTVIFPFSSSDDFYDTELEEMDGWTPLQFATAAGHTKIVALLMEASSIDPLSGKYNYGLRVAVDGNGMVTGRFESYNIGFGTTEEPQFSCTFSFFGFPADEEGEYVIASWDPPVWQPDATVEEGINSIGMLTLNTMENSISIWFADDPSGGCWNVVPFKQRSSFDLYERRTWRQVQLVARDVRLLESPSGAPRPEPVLKRGELVSVLKERDGWLLVEVERAGPVPEDESLKTILRFRGWLRESALFPISPPGTPDHFERLHPPVGFLRLNQNPYALNS